jgi:hypothetical protein
MSAAKGTDIQRERHNVPLHESSDSNPSHASFSLWTTSCAASSMSGSQTRAPCTRHTASVRIAAFQVFETRSHVNRSRGGRWRRISAKISGRFE